MSIRRVDNTSVESAQTQALQAAANNEKVLAAPAMDFNGDPSQLPKLSNKPASRQVTVHIRSTLADLATNHGQATWTPSEATLGSIFKQRQFTSLNGDTANHGDLRAVIVHEISARSVKNDFPLTIGSEITGVDQTSYSSTGKAYSMIAFPDQSSDGTRILQQENVNSAYKFSEAYPNYTADNLETKGIWKVDRFNFAMVASGHPLVTAILDNSQQIQNADVLALPENMVKISMKLYNTFMPLVKDQVRSQIKVADFSQMQVKLAPADYGSWKDALDALQKEASAELKAKHRRALGRVTKDNEKQQVNDYYNEKIADIQTELAHKPMNFSMELGIAYGFLDPGAAEE